jgi:lantibiotic leader peptide-processing serine protease
VAVLDTGFDAAYPDLEGQIDFANSMSLVPGEEMVYGLPDPFSQGTHTAGSHCRRRQCLWHHRRGNRG